LLPRPATRIARGVALREDHRVWFLGAENNAVLRVVLVAHRVLSCLVIQARGSTAVSPGGSLVQCPTRHLVQQRCLLGLPSEAPDTATATAAASSAAAETPSRGGAIRGTRGHPPSARPRAPSNGGVFGVALNHRCPHGPRLKRSEIEDRSKLCHSRSIDPYVAVSDRTCRSKTFLSNVRVSCRSRMVAKSRATNLLRVASQHISWHTSRRPPSDAPSSAPLTLPFSTWSRFTSRTAEAEVRPAPASPRCHKKRSPSVVSTTFFRHLADPRSFCRSRAACQSF
jgi:hypothetical protein